MVNSCRKIAEHGVLHLVTCSKPTTSLHKNKVYLIVIHVLVQLSSFFLGPLPSASLTSRFGFIIDHALKIIRNVAGPSLQWMQLALKLLGAIMKHVSQLLLLLVNTCVGYEIERSLSKCICHLHASIRPQTWASPVLFTSHSKTFSNVYPKK